VADTQELVGTNNLENSGCRKEHRVTDSGRPSKLTTPTALKIGEVPFDRKRGEAGEISDVG
jgi:hypothetical protein